MLGTHDALVVQRERAEELIRVEILQVARADQVVVAHTADRQERCLLESSIEQAIEHVDGTGRGGREAHSEATREFRVPDGGHGADFLVPDVDVPHTVLGLVERLHEAVDAVSRQAKDGVDSPIDQPVPPSGLMLCVPCPSLAPQKPCLCLVCTVAWERCSEQHGASGHAVCASDPGKWHRGLRTCFDHARAEFRP